MTRGGRRRRERSSTTPIINFRAQRIRRPELPDPYVASGGAANPSSWNRYAYVGGDPINFFDPRGLFECPASTSTSVTVCDTELQVDTWSAEYRQNLEYMGYYYSGQYLPGSPYALQPDPRDLISEEDRRKSMSTSALAHPP
jgi:hypothetical protein